MKTISKIISFLVCFCLILSIAITTIDTWCFDSSFYAREYEKLNTAENIGMSKSDLDLTTSVLLNYLKDRNLTLDVKANIKGVERQVFNQREIIHMEDVRDLYLNVIKLRNISLIIFILGFVYLIFTKNTNIVFSSFKKALLVFVFIFAFIGIFCLIDFDSFWTNFHYVFFPNNDYWLLDPRTDILIMMVPGQFFFDLCISIVFTFLISIVVLYFVFKFLDKKVFNCD